MRTLELIDHLQATLRGQLDLSSALRAIPLRVLQMRPELGSWSILEVIEHMNLSSGVYYRGLKGIFEKPANELLFKPDYSPGMMGAFSTKAMAPNSSGKISWRMKTMSMFEPRTATPKGWTALDEFEAMLQGMIDLLEQARTKGLEGEKVTSTLGPILRFKVGDAFTFPIAHQQRHMLQVERTLQSALSLGTAERTVAT